MPVRETILVPPTSDVRVEEWPRSRRGVAGRLASAIGSCVEWTFGVFSLIVGLSVIATVPILQFASLGYLLESAGRVARSGRLRDGVIGARRAARVGSCILGTWLLLQPIRWAFSVRYDAQLLGTDKGLRQATLVAVVLSVFLGGQILSATLRGGRLRSFFWPAPIWLWRRLCQGNVYRECRDHCWNFVTSLRVPFYFTKGVRGFGIALVWLIVPASIMVISTRLSEGPALLVALLGGLALATVLLYLPFLQVNFAKTDMIAAGFDWHDVRQQFTRAPIAFWCALFFTLLLAVPLYILKAELIPREAAWLPSIVFVVSIFPARLATGYAIARADRRDGRRFFLLRWLSRTAAVPVVVMYAFIVYLTQYISWYGGWSLYEQHAFLLPVPFFGL